MSPRLLLPFLALLTGCATSLVDRLELRLGMVPPLQRPALSADAAAAFQSHFTAGLSALGRNDLDAAIASWRLYVAAAPQISPQVREVRGFITLLERERARRFAQAAVAREAEMQSLRGDRLYLALLPFQLKSDVPNESRPFNRAILAMITSDLARVPGIRLLERQRIDALFRELKLSETDLVDPASALRGGRLLGAGTVVVGSVYSGAPPGPVYTGEGKYTISVNVSDVADGSLLGIQEAYGHQHNFLQLEKQIVHGILDMLGIREHPAEVDRVHTRSWDAYAQFTLGLKHLAANDFAAARAAFALALRFDPNFVLAEEYHLDTPSRLLDVEQIKAAAKALRG